MQKIIQTIRYEDLESTPQPENMLRATMHNMRVDFESLWGCTPEFYIRTQNGDIYLEAFNRAA